MILDGRIITVDQIASHLAGLTPNSSFQPKFPTLHNSSVPDIALYNSWMARGNPTPEQWLRNLASYYSGLGWNSMPHAFVLPDGRIGLGAPFNVKGTHSPSWNSISIGVECVGEFEHEIWAGTKTELAAVALFGELCKHYGWQPDIYARGVRGIHLHREDPATTHKSCPGRNVDKSRFVQRVLAYMGDSVAASETDRNGHADATIAAQTALAAHLTNEQLLSVKWLQERLNAKGAHLVVDGICGPRTIDVVKAWQRTHGLVVDGIAGALTRLSLVQ